MDPDRHPVQSALSLLGIDRLVLAIHDHSFPGTAEEELGCGSPYSEGAHRLLEFLGALGFNAIQLGPQGKTSFGNPSPYDSTLFSRSELSIGLKSLVDDPHWGHLLDAQFLKELVKGRPGTVRNRASYQYAYRAQHQALDRAFQTFESKRASLQHLELAYVLWCREHGDWLERDALYEAISAETGTDDWRSWDAAYQQGSIKSGAEPAKPLSDVAAKQKTLMERYKFQQFLAHQQHLRFRQFANGLGIKLYADLQIGVSQRDYWSLRHLFLSDYLLGAPPSRTNPDGQPWGYPVLDPLLYFEDPLTSRSRPGPGLAYFTRRIEKLLVDFDGLRIDHPHGIVCPWVYKSSDTDALHAVQNGARLFESPHSASHRGISRYAIAETDQLSMHGVPPYADGWVRELRDDQVERYAVLIAVIKDLMSKRGFHTADIICEVLSSCPYPLKRVMERHGLGRFRVTQKAKPEVADDVYRSVNAGPADWIMVGTHDTKPIWAVAADWSEADRQSWAQYLAARLEGDPEKRRARSARLAGNQEELIEAMFVDLFLGPARNVSIFFADLFGMEETYNKPGIVDDTNWMLSVPENFQQVYAERLSAGRALNLPRVLALALSARLPADAQARELIDQLERLAHVPLAAG
jgi:4-alpha-glucanotransferase